MNTTSRGYNSRRRPRGRRLYSFHTWWMSYKRYLSHLTGVKDTLRFDKCQSELTIERPPECGWKGQPYQFRQFLGIIESYNLGLREEP